MEICYVIVKYNVVRKFKQGGVLEQLSATVREEEMWGRERKRVKINFSAHVFYNTINNKSLIEKLF